MRTNLTRYTVTAPDVTGISLDVERALIYEGKTLQLSAFITPEDANQDVIWSSSDEGIATVDQNGLVTALKEGTATIYRRLQCWSLLRSQLRARGCSRIWSSAERSPGR